MPRLTPSQCGAERTVVLEVPARLDLVTVVRMVIATASTCDNALTGDRVDDLRWVVSEGVTNAIEASHLTSENGRVTIACEVLGNGVALEVTDDGPGVPEVIAKHSIDDPDRLAVEGGFGIPLMRHLSSSPVKFDSSPAGTTVSLELRQ